MYYTASWRNNNLYFTNNSSKVRYNIYSSSGNSYNNSSWNNQPVKSKQNFKNKEVTYLLQKERGW